jgi:DNA repair protein RecO
MSIQKTNSIVLSTTPYRESSLLITLFTSGYGRVQGIAKGIRSAGKRTIPVERGMSIEHTVYFKSTREIQTLADIHIVNFYPEIRSNIEKTSIRDTAFELVVASVKAGDHGPDLFVLLESFLSSLSSATNNPGFLLYQLWTFHFNFAALMGFAHNFSTCVQCNKPTLELHNGGYLIHEQGGVCCPACGQSRMHINVHIPQVLLHNDFDSDDSFSSLQTIHGEEWIRLIRLASAYCRVHLDFKYAMRSLDFLEQVFV